MPFDQLQRDLEEVISQLYALQQRLRFKGEIRVATRLESIIDSIETLNRDLCDGAKV